MKRIYLLSLFIFISYQGLSQSVNWTDDVACIIYNNCSGCHAKGGIAPFPLLSYDDVKPYANLIKEVVRKREMPPWPPNPGYHPLANERILSDEDIQTISNWVEAGSPSGDLSQAPAPPSANSLEVISQPGLITQLPKYTSRATDGDEYRCFVLPSNLFTDRFITGFEVIPGNRNMVHHVLVFQDQGDQTLLNDAADPDPGYLCFGGVGSNSAKMIGAWVPGQGVQFLPEGLGLRLPAGSNIVVQLHYPEGSAGQEDQTKINFQLSDASGRREVRVDFILNHFDSMVNGPLFIPAGTVKTFQQAFQIPLDVTIIGAAPHMHLIGKSIKSWAERPDGTIVPLIDIPHWDFKWQGFYGFQKPVTLPAGSWLKAEAVYDNTPANLHNPNHPPQDVALGEATTDEMMLVAFNWMTYRQGDEQLSLQTPDGGTGYECQAISTSAFDIRSNDPALRLFPNPVSQQLQIRLDNDWKGTLSLRIYNQLGQVVKEQLLEKHSTIADWSLGISDLLPGVYRLSVSNGKGLFIRGLVKE